MISTNANINIVAKPMSQTSSNANNAITPDLSKKTVNNSL